MSGLNLCDDCTSNAVCQLAPRRRNNLQKTLCVPPPSNIFSKTMVVSPPRHHKLQRNGNQRLRQFTTLSTPREERAKRGEQTTGNKGFAASTATNAHEGFTLKKDIHDTIRFPQVVYPCKMPSTSIDIGTAFAPYFVMRSVHTVVDHQTRTTTTPQPNTTKQKCDNKSKSWYLYLPASLPRGLSHLTLSSHSFKASFFPSFSYTLLTSHMYTNIHMHRNTLEKWHRYMSTCTQACRFKRRSTVGLPAFQSFDAVSKSSSTTPSQRSERQLFSPAPGVSSSTSEQATF